MSLALSTPTWINISVTRCSPGAVCPCTEMPGDGFDPEVHRLHREGTSVGYLCALCPAVQVEAMLRQAAPGGLLTFIPSDDGPLSPHLKAKEEAFNLPATSPLEPGYLVRIHTTDELRDFGGNLLDEDLRVLLNEVDAEVTCNFAGGATPTLRLKSPVSDMTLLAPRSAVRFLTGGYSAEAYANLRRLDEEGRSVLRLARGCSHSGRTAELLWVSSVRGQVTVRVPQHGFGRYGISYTTSFTGDPYAGDVVLITGGPWKDYEGFASNSMPGLDASPYTSVKLDWAPNCFLRIHRRDLKVLPLQEIPAGPPAGVLKFAVGDHVSHSDGSGMEFRDWVSRISRNTDGTWKIYAGPNIKDCPQERVRLVSPVEVDSPLPVVGDRVQVVGGALKRDVGIVRCVRSHGQYAVIFKEAQIELTYLARALKVLDRDRMDTHTKADPEILPWAVGLRFSGSE